MSADLSGEITAIATAVLAVFAIITAVYAVRAFRKQSDEVGILQQQMQDDRDRRKRAQASRVFIWIEQRPFDGNPGDLRPAACIRNTSRQPVYDIALVLGQVEDRRWTVLMPDEDLVTPGLGSKYGTVLGDPVFVTFRDADGNRWVRGESGALVPRS